MRSTIGIYIYIYLGITISDNHKCFFQSAFFIFLFYFIVSMVLVDLFCLRQNNDIIDYIATDTVDMA